MSLTDLAKSYEPKNEEPRVRERWENAHPFHVDPNAAGEPYCIVIPPPNVTASLHLGHALNNTLQDILIRYHRMRGYKTLWMPGTDHAGIATQTVVDKRLQEQGEWALKDYKRMEAAGENGREQFIKKVQAWKDEYEADITDQLKLMGCSCDWDRQRFTMDEVCARAVREAFFQLFKDGLIYRGKRLVNWDPVTQTALADDEVEMEEIDGHFWYLKYPIVERADGATEEAHGLQSSPVGFRETGDFVTVATTRPETMLGDTAVAVNPNDSERKKYAGMYVRLPIVNRIVPIVEDDYVVLPDPDSSDPKAKFASGFLKVTPAHDPNDWEIGQRHDLAVINVMAPDGTISREHGWREVEPELNSDEELDNIIGMDRFEAREAVVEYFRRNNLLAEVKPYTHSVGHSYRSHVPIEPYLSDQWYVRVTDDRLRGNALRAMAEDQRTAGDGGSEEAHGLQSVGFTGRGEDWEGGLRFYPERYAKTFQTWHENLRDWCISRQLWWGHRIPVWSQECGHRADALARKQDTEVFLVNSGVASDEFCIRAIELSSGSEVPWPATDEEIKLWHNTNEHQPVGVFLCFRWDVKLEFEGRWNKLLIALAQSDRSYGGWVRDPDVLDTWFSSALWPMSTMGWPEPGAFPNDIPEGDALLKEFNPSDVLCTAREIITLWVSRMVMFNTYFLNRLPFTDVFIHAMIQDGEGRKMSKSLGNGVDPRDIIKSKGTDAMRFTLAQMTTQTQDVRMPVEYDEQLGANTSPKFEIGRRFCNKLWNAARYAITTLSNVEGEGDPEKVPAQLIDRWILVKLWACEKSIERNLSPSRKDRESNGWEPYRFNAYADALYRFVWGDFCDWYLEGTKRTIHSDPVQQSILRATISCIIRWLHPVMPFITESLFDAVEELKVRPHHAIDGLDGPNALGIAATSSWPTIDVSYIGGKGKRSKVVSDFEQVKDYIEERVKRLDSIVSAIREVRSNQNIPDRRRVTFHVGDDDTWALVREAEGVTGVLAGLGEITRDPAPAGAVPVTVAGVEHALSNLAESVDAQAEQERLAKRKAELIKQIGNLKGRLANKNYVDKAPAHLVEETRSQLAEAERELAGVNDALARFG